MTNPKRIEKLIQARYEKIKGAAGFSFSSRLGFVITSHICFPTFLLDLNNQFQNANKVCKTQNDFKFLDPNSSKTPINKTTFNNTPQQSPDATEERLVCVWVWWW